MTKSRKITNGPSTFDVMVSLFEGKYVELTIEGLGRMKTVRFTEASCLTQCPHCVLVGVVAKDLFVCNYNMKTRKGVIMLQTENDESIQTLCALYSAALPRI